MTAVRVLVADEDSGARSLLATLLRQAEDVSAVLEVEDSAHALRVGQDFPVHVAVLDLNLPRAGGLEAALRLAALQPGMRIALRGADPGALRARAGGSGLPLFDKFECEPLVGWVERQADSWKTTGGEASGQVWPLAPKLELRCSVCGYGIVSRGSPARCPMCQVATVWTERGQLARNGVAPARLGR